MQVDWTPSMWDPLPLSWKYVRRLHGHSKRTWSVIECLSMPTFAAFIVIRAHNLPGRQWRSSQNKWIRQNLSILSSEPLMFITSMASFARSNFFSRWVVKCCDCFHKLQKTTTLRSGLWSKKLATSQSLYNKKRFLEQITNCMSISHWWNSIENPRECNGQYLNWQSTVSVAAKYRKSET